MNTDMMRLLLRRDKLTRKDWIDILEKARGTVAPRLERFKLPTFGDLACLDSENGFYGVLRKDAPAQSGGHRLDEHGMAYFADTMERIQTSGGKRMIPAWGLTKRGEWVAITVTAWRADPNSLEKALSVHIDTVDLQTMLEHAKVAPFSVLSIINEEVDNWRARKQVLYKEAKEFADDFKTFKDTILHGFV